MSRGLGGVVVFLAPPPAGAWLGPAPSPPPQLTINKPDRPIGQTGGVDVTAQAPNAKFTALTITLDQNGKSVPLVDLFAAERGEKLPPGPPAGVDVTNVDRNTLRITGPLGKQSVPSLQSGAARIVVTATRPSFLNLRQITTTATKDFQVRLEPPRIAVLSTHHYVNHGGAEFVVYRATPPDVASGGRVGDVEYPGFTVGNDPVVKSALFAL